MTAWVLACAVGVLTACSVWLLLRARTFDVVLGLTLGSYAVNVFIFLMGRIKFNAAPIIRAGIAPTLANYADPLPQALTLTAIVIGFAMTALVLALAAKSRFMNDSDACDATHDTARDAAPGATEHPPSSGAGAS